MIKFPVLLAHSCRIPHGMRGLKFFYKLTINSIILSHPAWDAWIEILDRHDLGGLPASHPAWDAWIEISTTRPSLTVQ